MSGNPPNVLYVTIDSIRADRVGHLGYESPTTPTIDDLAAEGMTFERATANGIPTYFSFQSLLGGVYPLSTGRDIGLGEDVTPIASMFAEEGYETAGFAAGNPWLTRNYGYDCGFGTFTDWVTDDEESGRLGTERIQELKTTAKRAVAFSDLLTDKLGLLGRTVSVLADNTPAQPAEVVTDAAIEWVSQRNGDRPFFLWVHYMDPHYPWVPRREDLSEFSDEYPSRLAIGRIWHTVAHLYKQDDVEIDDGLLEQIGVLYDAEVRRVDRSLQRLVDELEATGDWMDTNTAIVGDHGTELLDHGGFSHGPQTLYDEIVHVPLVFHGPDVPTETRRTAQLADVPTTLAGLSGVAPPDEYVGLDLTSAEREAVTTEVVYDFDPIHGENGDNDLLRARTEWPWKLIVNDHTDTTELYDLENDGHELNDRSNDNPEVCSRLEAAMDDFRTKRQREANTVQEKRRVRQRIDELRAAGKIP